MRQNQSVERRCSYVVPIEQRVASIPEAQSLSAYLSTLNVGHCDVVILDSSPGEVYDQLHRVFRWVARHVAVPAGADPVRCAIELAGCEKVIVAQPEVRYSPADLEQMCDLLEHHEVVEPQDYFDPLPWWGGIDAGRMLVHRGIEPYPDHGGTFGFRRGAISGLRGLGNGTVGEDSVRRLAANGAEVLSASEMFVQRRPPILADWLRQRPRQAGDDFSMPIKSAFFFALIPMTVLLTLLGGGRVATGYVGAVTFASMVLAVRGRVGATPFFPLRTCLYAPLWVFERSVSVYWALFRKLRGAEDDPLRVALPDRGNQRVASGE